MNLIRYNEVRGLPYDRPRTEDVRAFQNEQMQHHLALQARVDTACQAAHAGSSLFSSVLERTGDDSQQ